MKTRREFLARASQGFLGLGAIPALRTGSAQVGGTAQARGTGLVFDERYLDHVLPPSGGAPHPESPLRLRRIREMFAARGLDRELTPIPLMADPIPSIRRHHTPEHIESVRAIPITGPVAELTIAGALGGVDAVAQGKVRNVFCAIRPPGHHANNTGREEGFCFYSTAAITARYAQRYTASRRSLSSTGTTTTGMAPRTRSTTTPRCCFSQPTISSHTRARAIRR